MSDWDWQTDPDAAAAQEQVVAIGLRTGVEPWTEETPRTAVEAMEEARMGEELVERLQELVTAEVEDGVEPGSPEALQAALRRIEMEGREAGWRSCMAHIFEGSYDPPTVMRRVYSTALQTAPELAGNMTVAELATLLGETRSATDGRMMKMFRETGVVGRYQKRKESVERMRAGAKGNRNRHNGEVKRRVLAVGKAAQAAEGGKDGGK